LKENPALPCRQPSELRSFPAHAMIRWYGEIGRPFRVEHFGWAGWRGIFTEDPEGNTVELVAFGPSLLDQPSG